MLKPCERSHFSSSSKTWDTDWVKCVTRWRRERRPPRKQLRSGWKKERQFSRSAERFIPTRTSQSSILEPFFAITASSSRSGFSVETDPGKRRRPAYTALHRLAETSSIPLRESLRLSGRTQLPADSNLAPTIPADHTHARPPNGQPQLGARGHAHDDDTPDGRRDLRDRCPAVRERSNSCGRTKQSQRSLHLPRQGEPRQRDVLRKGAPGGALRRARRGRSAFRMPRGHGSSQRSGGYRQRSRLGSRVLTSSCHLDKVSRALL